MRPNFIPGMRMKGIGRCSKIPHLNKLKQAWIKSQAQQRKFHLEEKRRENANRPFME